MQVPLAEFIAVAGRVDINRKREKVRRRIFRFKPGELTALAGIFWWRLTDEVRTAWKDRAWFLNLRDIPGELKSLPEIFTDCNILRSINLEIDQLQKNFRSAILWQPNWDVSKYVHVFATERVKMATQTFRSFTMSLLLQLFIFGPDFSKLEDDEIVSRTKNAVIIHVHSCERIKKLFTIEGLCLLRVV